jgi:2-oxoisovalerate ferredoxin oxidoreductase beta subunit
MASTEYTVIHGRPDSFYGNFERKADQQHTTHYCPGCGHGIAQKLIAEAIDELGIQDRTIFVSPVGCSVFAYYYFDVGNVQAAHGRASAVATAVKRTRPASVVLAYQGDGDLAAIGTAEILHAANRGENITVFFINNAIYGMTGGQLAPTTLIGTKTTTSPFGRDPLNEGYPLRVAELLATLEGPAYIERVALGDNKGIMQAARAVRKAIRNQMDGLGFSLVEIVSPCPTVWKMDPLDAQRYVREELVKVFPPGVFRDETKVRAPRPAPKPAPELSEVPRILGLAVEPDSGPPAPTGAKRGVDLRIRVAGFGGQGVLLLGEILAEAGLQAGLHVSWLPSYGPEMRSGTSNCHVRVTDARVDSPMVSRPNVLFALNEPSLRKFLGTVQPGGLVFYNGAALPDDCVREDVTAIARPFLEVADQLGTQRAGNMVMIGAFLELSNGIEGRFVDRALRRLVKTDKWLEIDRRAIERGRELARR